MNDVQGTGELRADESADRLDALDRARKQRSLAGGYTLVCDFSVSPYEEPELYEAMQNLSMARLLEAFERDRPEPANP